VLEVIEYRAALPEAIVLSAYGAGSGWLLNIQTDATTEVIIAPRRFIAAYRFPDDEEAGAAALEHQEHDHLFRPLIR